MYNFLLHRLMLMIFFLSLGYLTCCCSIPSEIKYSKVKIHFQSKDQIKQLAIKGLYLDHSYFNRDKDGFSLIVVLKTKELKILDYNKFKYEILIIDLKKEYKDRP